MHPDALGKPAEGIHVHVAGIAIVDLALTVLGAYGIARLFGISFWLVFAFLMIIGLLVHKALGVRTTLTKWVFE